MPFDLRFQLPFDLLMDVPTALLAAAILGGPTLAWIVYRTLAGPRLQKRGDAHPAEGLWACEACASLTPVWSNVCYHCRLPRATPTRPAQPPGEQVRQPEQGVGVPVMAMPDTDARPAGVHATGSAADTGDRGDPTLAPPPKERHPVVIRPRRLMVAGEPAEGDAQDRRKAPALVSDEGVGVPVVDPELAAWQTWLRVGGAPPSGRPGSAEASNESPDTDPARVVPAPGDPGRRI